jgi:UDP-N-acetylmuramoylalanine--D-glutamate ligase
MLTQLSQKVMTTMAYTLIIGLGQTGRSCIAFLQRQAQPFVVFDTRKTPSDVPKDVECYTEYLPPEVWPKINRVVVSPGLDPNTPELTEAQHRHIPIIGDIELFAQHAKAPIIAITGTNAKSTVTTLVTDLINASGKTALIGGNVGIAALDLLAEPTPDYYVLELSSFQLETTSSLKAKVAALLNFSPNHLDRHPTLTDYWNAKLRIFNDCEHAVIVDTLAEKVKPLVPSLSIFGLTHLDQSTGVSRQQGMIYYQHQPLLPETQLSKGLLGEHNIENVLAALTIVTPLNLTAEPLKSVLTHFIGLPYRCKLLGEWNGIRWFNDSKSTTIASAIAAIKGIYPHGKHLILILGGVDKGQDFHDLTPTIDQYVDQVIVFGHDRQSIGDAVCVKPTYFFDTLDQAVHFAQYLSKPGDQVLFSPACASLDQFEGYIHRGRVFDELVLALTKSP